MAMHYCLFQKRLFKCFIMSVTKQLKNKIRTHGPLLTLYYCAVFIAQKLSSPFRLHILKSYSQAGEDLLIDRLLSRKKNGFYVDVGAHHPSYLSNTKRFYDRGWSGINIEPSPEGNRLFEKHRKRDINLRCGAGKTMGSMTFYEMKQRALSTFDLQQIDIAAKTAGWGQIKETYQIPIRTLENIFSKTHVHQPIDFMSIDIEGLEYEALDSNDWKKWRPHLICIETASAEKIHEEAVLKDRDAYFEKIGYKRVALTHNFGQVLNAIYKDTKPQ
jgi:FkbM family methyltransferase